LGIVDIKIAQADVIILLGYIETIGFGYLPEPRLENLKAYLMSQLRATKSDPITLRPGEGHPYGSLFLNNRGTKTLLIRLEVIER